MNGASTLLGLLFAVAFLLFGVSQVISAEATYIPLVSGGLKDLFHALDFFTLIMALVVAAVTIIGGTMLAVRR